MERAIRFDSSKPSRMLSTTLLGSLRLMSAGNGFTTTANKCACGFYVIVME
jgi:hypothetical protein